MFKIVIVDELPPVPWKNGGGVTREIVRHDDADGLLWRISLADVDSDGPFSRFDGMTRILTVITGDGIDLISPEGLVAARLAKPVRFSGDLVVKGRLVKGPIRDLNLIFDGKKVKADVQTWSGPGSIVAGPGWTSVWPLCGQVQLDGLALPSGAFGFGQSGRIEIDTGAQAVVLTISTLE